MAISVKVGGANSDAARDAANPAGALKHVLIPWLCELAY
jgi:hypothetical protein